MDAIRTTLALDEDVIAAARTIADRDRRTIGQVASELMRKGLERSQAQGTRRNGFPILPRRGAVVTLELVNALRDEED